MKVWPTCLEVLTEMQMKDKSLSRKVVFIHLKVQAVTRQLLELEEDFFHLLTV